MSRRRIAGSAASRWRTASPAIEPDGLDELGQRDPVDGVDRLEQLGHVGANGRIGMGLEPGDQPLRVLQDVAASLMGRARSAASGPPSGPRGSRAAALGVGGQRRGERRTRRRMPGPRRR